MVEFPTDSDADEPQPQAEPEGPNESDEPDTQPEPLDPSTVDVIERELGLVAEEFHRRHPRLAFAIQKRVEQPLLELLKGLTADDPEFVALVQQTNEELDTAKLISTVAQVALNVAIRVAGLL